MLLSYLILGHLLGDFIFQPTRLVMWKRESKWGVFVHVLVHFLINLVILAPFIYQGYYSLLIIPFFLSFCHFFIDQTKINYDLRHDDKVRPFVFDQILHLFTIFIIYIFFSHLQIELPANAFYEYYTNIHIINFLSFIVFASTAIEAYRYQIERERNKNAKYKLHLQQMAQRISVFTAIYIILMILAYTASSKDGFLSVLVSAISS